MSSDGDGFTIAEDIDPAYGEALRRAVAAGVEVLAYRSEVTPGEIRVADLIRDGKRSKEIAALLGLSPSSVQWHRKNIREKLGLTHQKVNLATYLASLNK